MELSAIHLHCSYLASPSYDKKYCSLNLPLAFFWLHSPYCRKSFITPITSWKVIERANLRSLSAIERTNKNAFNYPIPSHPFIHQLIRASSRYRSRPWRQGRHRRSLFWCAKPYHLLLAFLLSLWRFFFFAATPCPCLYKPRYSPYSYLWSEIQVDIYRVDIISRVDIRCSKKKSIIFAWNWMEK